MRGKKKFAIFSAVCVILLIGLVLIDQYTKLLAIDKLKDSESYVFIEGILNFTYVENPGAAWGSLSGKVNLLMVVTVLLMPLFIYVYFRAEAMRKHCKKSRILSLLQVNMTFLMAGAIGNFIDRISYGYVVDFIQVRFIDFPVFNIADCYITVGSIVFCIILLFKFNEEEIDILLKGYKKAKKSESIQE